ncbi:MAG: sulfatase-like hydrolase/transferase [Pirellulales bacterium]|nr:sulfatase-like hydrolase/transferase [Pirellulales bacterium]
MFLKNDPKKQAVIRAKRWEFRWGLLGVLLIAIAIGTLMYNQWAKFRRSDDVKRQAVLPDLRSSPCIELESGALRDWNVLFISLDTTRADHLNCYGYEFTKTPVLNKLARHGVLYSQAFTPSPTTLPAHSSMITGLYPLHHGVRANGTFQLGKEQITLGEILSEAGYQTGAAISAFVLDSQFGIDQGFQTFDDDLTVGMKYSPQMFRERAAELTNVPVAKWLREHGQEKFFFWIHYFDPHAPYAPPEPYRTGYARNPYDGEIDYADEQIGKLLDVLDEIGVRDRTLVIFVSDHGEGLGQHGEQTHSLLVYDSTLHVPMIFSAPPPFPQGRVVHDQVCLVDVMPTVLDLLGLPLPDHLDGVSLLRKVQDVRPAICIETLASMVLHGWAPLIGIRQADYKFILAPERELYDLHRDPLEVTNLHQTKTEIAKKFYHQLLDIVGSDDPAIATAVDQDLSMDEETRHKLEALGYVGSGTAEDKPPETLPDPKVMVYHWETVQHGVQLRLAGQVQEAVDILEKALEKASRDVYSRQNLSNCYAMMGDYDKAIEVLEPALQLPQKDNSVFASKATLLLNFNKIKEAEAIYQQILKEEPENTEAMLGLARISYLQGDADAAIEKLQEIIKLNPGTAGPIANNQIGMIHLHAGRYDEARQAYQSSLKIDGLNGQAHDGIANVLLAEEKYEEAMDHLQLALRFNPVQLDAMASLGGLYRKKGELEAGAAWCQRALSINSQFPAALNNLGLIYRQQDKLQEAEECYRKAIEAAPRLAPPRLNLAALLLEKKDESGAVEQYAAAVRVNPNHALALVNLATFHFRQNQLTEASRLLERAVKLKPDYAMAHKYLGLIYANIDRPKDSIPHLQKALEYDSDDPEADNLRQLIKKMQALAAEQSDEHKTPSSSPDNPEQHPTSK